MFKSAVCVKECPKPCQKDCVIETPSAEDGKREVDKIYETNRVAFMCLPDTERIKDETFVRNWLEVYKHFLENPVGSNFKDMWLSSRAMFLSFFMALIYCLLYIYLMSKFGHYIAWFAVILIQLALIGTSAAFFYIYVNVDSLRIIQSYQDTTALALGIIFSVLSVVYMILLCCGYAQLKVAIGIMDASADFLQKTKTILLVPLGFFFVEVVVFALWLICFGCIQAIGELEADPDSAIPQMKKIDNSPQEQRKIDYINAFMVFGIIWVAKFIEHKTCMITMISAATYYFNSNTNHDGDAEVGLAFQFAYLKHAGSIACGSFIITCVHMLRFMILPIAERCSRA